MEKKTIGGFIAALRKANGMTQKDLAERLNVSDKTVSRWERDDGAPDLSLIPVIAEVFGVTCDELLRGERKSPEQRMESAVEPESTAKGEKQRQRLLKSTLSQYQSRTYIAMGVSVLGMIAALICNLAFLKAVFGFLLGSAFFAASIVCQAVFMNRAFLSVEDAGLDSSELSAYKRRVLRLAQRSIGLTVTFIGFTFPLVLVDAYMGLGADSMLLFGLAGAAVFLLVYAVILYFLNVKLFKMETYRLDEREASVYFQNHGLKRKCAVILVILLLVTAAAHSIVAARLDAVSLSNGTEFYDYESFVQFMEQDVDDPRFTFTGAEPVNSPTDDGTYFDRYGNEITEEEALGRELTLSDGTVVCRYLDRNDSVATIRYTEQDGSLLPITVVTFDDLVGGQAKSTLINAAFVTGYCLEILAVILIYFKKRAK